MVRFILALIAALSLAGCGTLREAVLVEKVPCLLPDDLKKKEVLPDHPEVKTPLPAGGEKWAADRAAGAKAATKHSDTVDLVQEHCQ